MQQRSASESLCPVRDAIGWDAAAMSVAQKDAGCLGKLGGICGLGDATPQRRQLERNEL
jgi:hypothetical protein